MGKEGRKRTWLGKGTLIKWKCKKGNAQEMESETCCKENTGKLPRCAKIRSGKIRHSWNSIGAEFGDVKTIKKDFYRHVGQKRMIKEKDTH